MAFVKLKLFFRPGDLRARVQRQPGADDPRRHRVRPRNFHHGSRTPVRSAPTRPQGKRLTIETTVFVCLFVVLAFHLPVLDGFDWHFQASVHFTLSNGDVKSLRHQKIQEKFFCECRESNPGLLGEKQECYPCVMQSPHWDHLCESNLTKKTSVVAQWFRTQLLNRRFWVQVPISSGLFPTFPSSQ